MTTLRVDRADGVVTVTLNRPERKNAITATMAYELREVLLDVAGRRDDRVLVLTGAGKAFCAGADLVEDPLLAEGPLRGMRLLNDIVLALHRLPQPTIARVGGVAVGAGLNLALGCDLVVAAADAQLSQLFSKRGLALDGGGSWLLPRLVGLHRAKELALLPDMLPAPEAAAIGLVNKVVPADELDAAVADWATRLAAGPPLALSITKAQLNASFGHSMDEAVEAEAQAQAFTLCTADVKEGMRAFVQRRDPQFEGR